jgi:hypothetical protein
MSGSRTGAGPARRRAGRRPRGLRADRRRPSCRRRRAPSRPARQSRRARCSLPFSRSREAKGGYPPRPRADPRGQSARDRPGIGRGCSAHRIARHRRRCRRKRRRPLCHRTRSTPPPISRSNSGTRAVSRARRRPGPPRRGTPTRRPSLGRGSCRAPTAARHKPSLQAKPNVTAARQHSGTIHGRALESRHATHIPRTRRN